MSAVIADPAAVGSPRPGGKKKLLIVIAAVLLLVLLAGGGAVVFMKKKANEAALAAEAEGSGGEEAPVAAHKPSGLPTYLPLDPFVVNLADRDADRYAQIGITLEMRDPAFAEQLKGYMPSVRNAILLVLTRKSSRELLDVSGKELLANEIMREAVRPMGIDIAAPEPVTPAQAEGGHDDKPSAAAAKKPARKGTAVKNPLQNVHFSSFIVQ